jgi:hypothetical protein
MPSFRPFECTYAAVPLMPSGNFAGSGTSLPVFASRWWVSQQSSMFTYW